VRIDSSAPGAFGDGRAAAPLLHCHNPPKRKTRATCRPQTGTDRPDQAGKSVFKSFDVTSKVVEIDSNPGTDLL